MINGSPVATFPTGSGGLYEEVANTGQVVVQDGPANVVQNGETIPSPIESFKPVRHRLLLPIGIGFLTAWFGARDQSRWREASLSLAF